ncbi:exodeoxyribonuclease V subunit beta [Chitinivorax sp. PXF-14]|uniref:exodeoxyribonuclease V subunit beta n=1 Tax=Chitinivorax sp. PXF-14 TaxID=3230488 RepID=UPI0034656E67
MSHILEPLVFPLHGSRLIEASAGTGKTWTIAALYLRLVLGHGDEQAFARPLLPADILVMTFTRAATRELSDRIRARLVEAAKCFRGEAQAEGDAFLAALIDAYPPGTPRLQAAYRLTLAAEAMDDAAIFTIDAWCQRMLREHAFDSGNLFDEALLSDQTALFDDAVRDYWRQQVYRLDGPALAALLQCWSDLGALAQATRHLVNHAGELAPPEMPLAPLINGFRREQQAALAQLKHGWVERAGRMQAWLTAQLADNPKCFNGTKLKLERALGWFDALRSWAADPAQTRPELNDTAWNRLAPDGLLDACSKGVSLAVPADFDAVSTLQAALAALPELKPLLLAHASHRIAARMAELKRWGRQFGFADMLERLRAALEGPHGAALRTRIVGQFPVALIDEFQDTSPAQYRLFDLLYRVADNEPAHALLLIGDPKQSIYGFRGADIHSYLAARRATSGRHYVLDTNFRSTGPLVAAVNRVFLHAEGADGRPGHAAGAFRFRRDGDNPLPYEAVQARGRAERLCDGQGEQPALTLWQAPADDLKADDYRRLFAARCAEHIVQQLNDAAVGFRRDAPDAAFTRLKPADIAVLVRDRNEAQAVRRALQQRGVASVYLSDKESVMEGQEAADLLRWLQAVANPLDGRLARAAFATPSADLPLPTLAALASDDHAWEARVEQLKALHLSWQRQGVLAMLRRLIHELDLPARLLATPGGERRLTNLLHLAELLQGASQQLDGEQALIRWLAEQIESGGEAGDERILRLESDAELVKVITVHKSKGLEYPLVYLPFAVTARPVERRNRSFVDYVDATGQRRLDLALSEPAMAAAESARLAEDLRLLYVALTRPRHALWLGIAALPARRKGENRLHESALGYLLTGGAALAAGQLAAALDALRGGNPHIAIETVSRDVGHTMLSRIEARPPLIDAPVYRADFERDWGIGSFSALTRAMATPVHALPVPIHALQQKLMDAEIATPAPTADEAPWHRFPRGALPGNFLHEQLEWLGHEGFASVHAPAFDVRLAARCERAGWEHRQEDVIAWIKQVAVTPLPPLGAALSDIRHAVPEMEFWFPADGLDAAELDRLCHGKLLDGRRRPALPVRKLQGMLKGYIDLVFEHEGRYWVIDYKSNALGAGDADYHASALADAMAAHRYEVQGALYLLALHRLLKNRLGAHYDPARQLGGAMFLFLRGIAGPTHGCHLLPADTALLDALDSLMGDATEATA